MSISRDSLKRNREEAELSPVPSHYNLPYNPYFDTISISESKDEEPCPAQQIQSQYNLPADSYLESLVGAASKEEAKPSPEEVYNLPANSYDSDIVIEIDYPADSAEPLDLEGVELIPETQELPADMQETLPPSEWALTGENNSKRVKFTECRSRLVTATGISTDTQVSQLPATPSTQEYNDQKKIKIRRRSSSLSPHFFSSSSSSTSSHSKPSKTAEKEAAIRAFHTKKVDVQTITKEYKQVIGNFAESVLTHACVNENKIFIGRLLRFLASEYTGRTLSSIIKAETNNPQGEHTTNKIIYFLLCKAAGYGNTRAQEKVTAFRQKNLSTYAMIKLVKYPLHLQPAIAALRQVLSQSTHTFDKLSDAQKATMKAMDSFVDNATKEFIDKNLKNNESIKNSFKKLMEQHIEKIIESYPTTSGHHIALLAYKFAAIIMNADGAPLPDQDSTHPDKKSLANKMAQLFVGVTANANYEEAKIKLASMKPEPELTPVRSVFGR